MWWIHLFQSLCCKKLWS